MKNIPKETKYFTDYAVDFDGGSFEEKRISGEYKYERRGPLFAFSRFLLYRVIAKPIAYLHSFAGGRVRVFGKEKLKEVKGGFFVYGNHTQPIGDAFMPNAILFAKRVDIVVSSKNLSLPFLGGLLKYLGAIPRPTELSAMRNFGRAVESSISRGAAVVIYPEARLWPYMKDIRPFGSESFAFPVKLGAPSFSFTRVYKRRGGSYRCEIYIDGPFYPDSTLDKRSAREKLRDEIRAKMLERAEASDIEIIRYERLPESQPKAEANVKSEACEVISNPKSAADGAAVPTETGSHAG